MVGESTVFDPKSSEDLKILVLQMAAAGAVAPEGRVRVARWLRAALELVEADEPPPEVKVTPAMVRALEEIATSLTTAGEKAEFLAEKAALTPR